jgi:hypothetical protein
MRMNVDQIRDYEKFAQHVRTALPTVLQEKKIVEAIKNNSGADAKIIQSGLMWNSGPIVNVAALVPHQEGGHVITPTGGYRLHSNTIDVSMADVGRFQTGQDVRTSLHGRVHLITVILLHELTHWAREQSGTNETADKEDGFEFEKEAYGQIIDR